MEREKILISEENLNRQRAFAQQVRDWNSSFGRRLAFVDTYGCQQNEADSERIRGMLTEMGYCFTTDEAEADVIVINTCAVREHAEMRVLGNVGALVHTRRRKPDQIICLCGCMMQEPHMAEKIQKSFRHVSLVFGPHALWRFPELLFRVISERGRVFETTDEHGSVAEGLPVLRQGWPRAWVSIMYGCNNFCTYCIVPYVRGRERSRASEQIIAEVRTLVAQGYKEITLLGQNVNSYGRDLVDDMDFPDLLRAINDIPGEFVIRFMTSHPKDASQKLFDAMAACEKVERHLHLPFQAGNDRVLQAMNRRYTAEQYLEKIDAVRKLIPDIVLTSDVIVGFPGETEEEFEDTVCLLERVQFDALFTFIYSPRTGTPAAQLPDPASKQEKQKWFERLLEVQNEISAARHAACIGRTVRVLVDGESEDKSGILSSRTSGGRLVRFSGESSLVGTFCDVKITGATTWSLFGDLQ